MYPSEENRPDCGYSLVLKDGLSWRLSADPQSRDWLESFAAVFKLQSAKAECSCRIHFVSRRSRWKWTRNPKALLDAIPSGFAGSSDWRCRDLPRLRLWYQTDSPDVICELTPPKTRSDSVLTMSYAVHGVYHGLALRGGFPLHSALVEKDGIGILLVGNEGIGKSTCCRRLPDSWNVIADDSVVITRGQGDNYYAHPFPTWSELINCGETMSWDTQRPVRVGAAMFLSRASEIEIVPLGRGIAAVMLTASASYVCNVGQQKPNHTAKFELRKRLFLNACAAAMSVQCMSLKLSPRGAFWENIQDLMSDF